jgi:hypothetical protein
VSAPRKLLPKVQQMRPNSLSDALSFLTETSWVTAVFWLLLIGLWLGLFNAPGEWPWTYMFLVVIELVFLLDPSGRSLGFDALSWPRLSASPKHCTFLSLVV